MEIMIRKMHIKDLERINDFSRQLGYDLSLAETKNQIEKILSTQDHIAYVVVLKEKVVGWIHAFVSLSIESKPFVEIGGLVVDEKYRGKGMGNKLVDKIKEWTIEMKISSLRVRSNVTRLSTHEFYKKAGFEEIKEQKVFSLNTTE
jgi:N-acetylglutamate synthase-like GNAT family acetyltransferase